MARTDRAVGGAYNAVRLSSASLAERTVCNGRTTVRRPLADAAVSSRRAEEGKIKRTSFAHPFQA
jgi:hypothetical protein